MHKPNIVGERMNISPALHPPWCNYIVRLQNFSYLINKPNQLTVFTIRAILDSAKANMICPKQIGIINV